MKEKITTKKSCCVCIYSSTYTADLFCVPPSVAAAPSKFLEIWFGDSMQSSVGDSSGNQKIDEISFPLLE